MVLEFPKTTYHLRGDRLENTRRIHLPPGTYPRHHQGKMETHHFMALKARQYFPGDS